MAGTRILVVEDDPGQRGWMTAILAQLAEKPHLLEATDGREAIALALHEKPDLILLDDTLPKLSGATVCHELKRDPETAAIKILLTARTRRSRGLLQADAYLDKPFDRDELLGIVAWLLKH